MSLLSVSSFSGTKVALEAMQERQTLSELCKKYDLHPNQITLWKKQLKESSANVFKDSQPGVDERDRLIEQLYKTIGELTMDVDFLKKMLKGLNIIRRNQVWELDISYIPMKKGFMYLFAIIDVYSRYVVGWSLSNTMTSEWCSSVLEQAIATHGKLEIINSDQGSQFTSTCYVELLKSNGISISMDSRGRALDDSYLTLFGEYWLRFSHSNKFDGILLAQYFIERLWRSVKQEYVYLAPCSNGEELWKGLDRYFEFYNNKRVHQSLEYQTPADVYKNNVLKVA